MSKLKQRILSFAIVVAMMLTWIPVASAADVPTLQLVVAQENQAKGSEKVGVTLSYTATDAVQLSAFQLDVLYDSAYLEPDADAYAADEWSTATAFQGLNALSSSAWTKEETLTQTGRFIIGGYTSNAIYAIDAGETVALGTLYFNVLSTAGETELKFSTTYENKLSQTIDNEPVSIENIDFTSTATINVVETGVTLAESEVEVDAGDAVTVQASAFDASVADVTTTVAWSVSAKPTEAGDNDVAIGENTGVITVDSKAVAGDYTITATGTTDTFGTGVSSKTATLTVSRADSEVASVSLSNGTETMTVPADGATANDSTAFTATVKDQYDDVVSNPSVGWTITNSTGGTVDGVTIADGVITVSNDAKADIADTAGIDFTVTATCGEESDTATVKISRATATATSVVIYKNSEEITADTIAIPTSTTDNTATYTAETLDQYSAVMNDKVETWSFATATDYVTAADGTVTVKQGATANQEYTLTATNGALSADVTITVVDVAFTVSGDTASASNAVTIATSPTYGVDWSDIVTIKSSDITAKVGTTEVTGTYSLDVSGTPDAGTQNYTVLFNGGDYTNVEVFSSSVNVAQKSISDATITLGDSLTYNGESQTQAVASVSLNGTDLTVSTDYTISDNVQTAASDSYTLKATGTGNYTGEATETFSIAKADITSIATTVAAGSKLASDNLTASELKTAMSLPETVTVNYGESKTATLSIVWADATETFDAKGGTYTYEGTVTPGDNFNAYSTTLDATMTVSAVTATMSLATQSATKTMATVDSATAYSDLDMPIEITVAHDKNVAGATYTISGWDTSLADIQAKDATDTDVVLTLTPTFSGNPDWATLGAIPTFTLTITNKFPVNVSFTTAIDDIIYGETLATPEATATEIDDGLATTSSWSYLYEGPTEAGVAYSDTVAPTDAGSYTVTASYVSETHSGTASDSFTISPKALTISGATATDRYYDPGNKVVEITAVTFTEATLTINEDFTVVGEMANADAGDSKAATATVTLLNENYSLATDTYATTVDIAKLTLDALEGEVPDEIVYVGDVYAVGYNVPDVIGMGEITLKYNGAESAPTTAGTCIVTYEIAEGTNYNAVASTEIGTFTIYNKMAPTVAVTTNDDEDETLVNTGLYTVAEPVAVDGVANAYTVAIQGTSALTSYDNYYTVNGAWIGLLLGTTMNGAAKDIDEIYWFANGTGWELISSDGALNDGGDGTNMDFWMNTTESTSVTRYMATSIDGADMLTITFNFTAYVKPSSSTNTGTKIDPDASTSSAEDEVEIEEDVEETTVAIVGGFTDVTEDDYYAAPVEWAVENNITTGTSSDGFSPDTPASRGQVVTFLYRAFGEPTTAGENSFGDVEEDSYYGDAVKWALEMGITSGMADGVFGTEETCSRAQIITFMWRAAGSPEMESSHDFADVESGSYYEQAVLWAVENDITNGMGDGTYGADEPCTRAQIVTFLYRFMGE